MCFAISNTKKEKSKNILCETAAPSKYVAHVVEGAVSKEHNSLLRETAISRHADLGGAVSMIYRHFPTAEITDTYIETIAGSNYHPGGSLIFFF